MHIGVLGGSGRTGEQIILEALNRGYSVSTLVRNKNKVNKKLASKITLIQGDATCKEDISLMLTAGIDILIHAVSVPFFHTKPTALYSNVTSTVISAWGSVHHSCKHYVVMSSFGTHHGRKLGFPFKYGYEFFLGDVADDKENEESLLQKSNLPWTVVKAVLLNDANCCEYVCTQFDDFIPSIMKRVSRKTIAQAILDLSGDKIYLTTKVVISNK